MEEVSLQREEYLSLNIKYTCSWCNKFVVYIYIYIYIFIMSYVIYIYINSKQSSRASDQYLELSNQVNA